MPMEIDMAERWTFEAEAGGYEIYFDGALVAQKNIAPDIDADLAKVKAKRFEEARAYCDQRNREGATVG